MTNTIFNLQKFKSFYFVRILSFQKFKSFYFVKIISCKFSNNILFVFGMFRKNLYHPDAINKKI